MKYLNLIFFFILSSTSVNAQQATNVSGGAGTIGNISLDWSFGELTLVDNVRINSLLISQGLIQPNKGIYTEADEGISAGELKIFPNPTNGVLNIWAGFLVPGKLSFEFFDAKGSRILYDEKSYSGFNTYQFVLDKYAAASYPLKVTWKPATGKVRKTTLIIIKQ